MERIAHREKTRSTLIIGMWVVLALAVVVAGCSSQSTSDTKAPTTTAAPTTTDAPATTTTVAPTTTVTSTTEPSLTDDPEALLDAINTAMIDQTSFLGRGQAEITDAGDPSESYVTVDLIGGRSAPDSSWIITTMFIDSGPLTGTLQFEKRKVDGVDYDQDPVNGGWEIDDESSPNPVADILNGELILTDVTAQETTNGFTIAGTYPADPDVELVTIDVDGSDLTLQRIATMTRSSRGDLLPLVPEGDTDVIVATVWEFGNYGMDLAPLFAPPEGTPTVITRIDNGAFQLQLPVAWGEVTPEEIGLSGSGIDRAWRSEDDIITMAVSDDLVAEGIGPKNLDEYVELITQGALSEAVITDSITTVNVQGIPMTILRGTSDETGKTRFARLIAMADSTTAFNITIVGPAEAFDANGDEILFALNTFLIGA